MKVEIFFSQYKEEASCAKICAMNRKSELTYGEYTVEGGII